MMTVYLSSQEYIFVGIFLLFCGIFIWGMIYLTRKEPFQPVYSYSHPRQSVQPSVPVPTQRFIPVYRKLAPVPLSKEATLENPFVGSLN